MRARKGKRPTAGTNSEPRDFVAIARKYAADILSDKIPACKWVKLACQRQVDDLARPTGNVASKTWVWHFDEEKAAHVCRFIEKLPHIKGKWATPYLRLEPWQIFILTTIFGWVDEKGLRRFKTVYIEVPRKNAKSTLTSGVALYCLCEDEPGAEIYSAATKKDQAKIVWEVAKRMVQKTPGLRRRFGVEVAAHSIFVEDRAASFIPLSSDEDGLDGLSVYFASVDELHAHKTAAVWDVLDSGTGARAQSLLWAITTAGWNQAGVCYEQRTYVTKILEKFHEDERYFGIVYTIDLPEKLPDGTMSAGDDWRSPAAWAKANPNYGVSVRPDDIAAIARKAMQSARSQNNFLTKRLNVWVTAQTAYFNLHAWRTKCYREGLRIEDFVNDPCWIGLDLSAKTDLADKVRLFRREESDGAHYYVFGTHYLPQGVIDAGAHANAQHYVGWAETGNLDATEGDATDFDLIEEQLRDDVGRYQVKMIGCDPWNAEQLRQHMEAQGAPWVTVPMNVSRLSEPMKELDALILTGRIHHDGDPAAAWMIGNVVTKEDRNKNVFPNKERPQNKIDFAVALIIALGNATRQTDTSCGLLF
jgi:phage terminase large subunit-like protein